MTGVYIRREDFVPLEEDAHGAWMSSEGKVAAFLSWFTDDPVAEVPLNLIIMLSSCKNPLRLVSKLFQSHADEGTRRIIWEGPRLDWKLRKCQKPNSLLSALVKPVRNIDGRLRDRLPNLKSIDCSTLDDTLMELNGCPTGVEELRCSDCTLIQSLIPLAACTNLRKLDVSSTNESSLKLDRMCET